MTVHGPKSQKTQLPRNVLTRYILIATPKNLKYRYQLLPRTKYDKPLKNLPRKKNLYQDLIINQHPIPAPGKGSPFSLYRLYPILRRTTYLLDLIFLKSMRSLNHKQNTVRSSLSPKTTTTWRNRQKANSILNSNNSTSNHL